ncbi:small ribosomal subunit protein uS2m-like [Brevipalpus obovatus]|uniref:small ribosomal subunit protein uS2m-like n=1 Tax=Brevipalpus obovatus TaxID=246614 RepID=UPI003D9F3AD6
MTPYVYGNRLGISIIDLNKTLGKFREALNITAHVAYRGGIVLFISNHKETAQMVEKMAMECGEYAHCRPYNSKVMLDSESYFQKLMRPPDLIILMSSYDGVFLDHKIIMDAASTLIPTIGIVDTNSDPRLITYPIPANDDTPCAVKLYCSLFKEAINIGKAKRKLFIM